MSDAPDMSDQFVHISEVEKTRHRSEDRPRVRCAVAVVRANRFAARCVLWVKELLDFPARFPSFEGFASRPAWPRIPDQALSGPPPAAGVRTDFDRAPSFGSADQRTEHHFRDRAFTEGIGNDLEAPPLHRSSKLMVRIARRCVTRKRRWAMQASKSSMKQATPRSCSRL
jgi:hypothetical protein